MIHTLFFIMCLVASSIGHRDDGIHSTLNEDLEMERHLKLINKSPIKSIQTKHGYIVDCIDVYKQPAFDHPLLKNHTLQMKPSFQRINENPSVKNSSNKLILGIEKYRCPKETVPIRRITKEDLIRHKSFLNNYTLARDSLGHHVASAYTKNVGTPYFGVSGTTSVFNPKVSKDQTSSSHLWVQNGKGFGTNKIMVGWRVSPHLYGDYATHMFSYWTRDNSKSTGCFDTICPGFVRISNAHYQIGSRVWPTSVYNGKMYEMKLSIAQDSITKNWLVLIADQFVGYFPAALFSNLNKADQVGWGGSTTTPANTRSPPMGSGSFPDNNFIHACYFRKVAYRNEARKDIEPEELIVETFSDARKCFGIDYNKSLRKEFGYSVHFGGPGGACG